MKIIFTSHAEIKSRNRMISKSLVREALRNPDFVFPSYANRERAYKKFGKNYLMVVFIREKKSIFVITQHWVVKLKKSK